MTNLSKAERAKYDIVIGSRRQVYNGTAHHTSGGLTKNKSMRYACTCFYHNINDEKFRYYKIDRK